MAKPRFARFDQPGEGIRGRGKLLINYRGKNAMPGGRGKRSNTVLVTKNLCLEITMPYVTINLTNDYDPDPKARFTTLEQAKEPIQAGLRQFPGH